MADDLADFYAEIATVEAQTAHQEPEAPPPAVPPPAVAPPPAVPPPAAAPPPAMPPPPALPPPPRPPTSILPPVRPPPTIPPPPVPAAGPLLRPPPPPPPRPPVVAAVITHKPVISAPPQPAAEEPEEPPAALPQPAAVPSRPPAPTGHTGHMHGKGPQQQKQQQQQASGGARIGIVRTAAGERWVDTTLSEWPDNDFRIFVGNLGTEVTQQVLTNAFQHYSSFQRARVVKNVHTNKSKGYGFVSLMDPVEGGAALREMHGKYIGNRPCQLKRSNVEARTVTDRKGRPKKREVVEKPEKANKRQAMAPPRRGTR